jgi:phage baseplate assembly protein W
MAKYVDLSTSINTKHPISGDIGKLTDSIAINNAIKNLLFTRKGTIPHNRYKGTDLWKLLGEMNTAITRHNIKLQIEQTILDFEPRVKLLAVLVEKDEQDENKVNIAIGYSIIATNQQAVLQLDLSLNR